MKKNFFGYSTKEASRLTGIPYVTVWRHANGDQKINVESAILYHQHLGIPILELIPELKLYLVPKTLNEAENKEK